MSSCHMSVETWPKNNDKNKGFFNNKVGFVGIIPYLVHAQYKDFK